MAAADRLSALPDGVLHHILGFLQADEAVCTSVLSPRWRDLWRSMPVLRVTRERVFVQPLRRFMDHLLLLRDHSTSLDAFLLDCVRHVDDDVAVVNLWIRHALLCRVLVLSVSVACSDRRDRVPLHPPVSKHLTVLDLHGPSLQGRCLDFSRCPELKYLTMTSCDIDAEMISSRSLECLCIDQCRFGSGGRRARISAPGLVSLKLTSNAGRTPVLEDMPLLVTAEVSIDDKCEDTCYKGDPGYCDDESCVNCYGIDDGSAGSVLLQGLAAATELKLISVPEAFILKRDLRFCPTFTKLKTLLVNGWCVAIDDQALICMLQHSLALENLSLELLKEGQPRNMVVSKAVYNSVEQLLTLENLRRIDVKCHQVDERVDNFLRCMVSSGIPLEEIRIQQKNMLSESFTFICTGFSSGNLGEGPAANGLST